MIFKILRMICNKIINLCQKLSGNKLIFYFFLCFGLKRQILTLVWDRESIPSTVLNVPLLKSRTLFQKDKYFIEIIDYPF